MEAPRREDENGFPDSVAMSFPIMPVFVHRDGFRVPGAKKHRERPFQRDTGLLLMRFPWTDLHADISGWQAFYSRSSRLGQQEARPSKWNARVGASHKRPNQLMVRLGSPALSRPGAMGQLTVPLIW